MSTADRHFIVAREGRCVIIREVTTGSSAHTLNKPEAWAFAQRLAAPAPKAVGHAKVANDISFQNLNGMRTVIQTAAVTQSMWEATKRQDRKPEPKAQEPTKPAATDKQKAFIAKLAAERNVTLDADALNIEEAKTVIDALLKAPKPAQPAQTTEQGRNGAYTLPAGRYAVENEDGALRFYRVDRPTEGRWAGYTFLKVQAGGDLHPIKGNAAATILRKIEQDPRSASLRYGQEIGACGVCGRTLTDEASRAAGIGPVCAQNAGW